MLKLLQAIKTRLTMIVSINKIIVVKQLRVATRLASKAKQVNISIEIGSKYSRNVKVEKILANICQRCGNNQTARIVTQSHDVMIGDSMLIFSISV